MIKKMHSILSKMKL